MTKCQEIIARVPIENVLQRYGIQVHTNRNIKCFVHDDSSPSMSVKNGKVKCFACQWSGNVIDVVQHFERCNARTAIVKINNWYKLFQHIPKAYQTLTQLVAEKKKREKESQEYELRRQSKLNKQSEIFKNISIISKDIDYTENLIKFFDDVITEKVMQVKSCGRDKDLLPLAPEYLTESVISLSKTRDELKQQLEISIEQEFSLNKQYKDSL